MECAEGNGRFCLISVLDTYFNIFLFSMGYNGRECILRALCESAQYFVGKGTNMVEELIRVVFT